MVAGMEMVEVCCPTCGERFEVAEPSGDEVPCRIDYDCEVCCRPLLLVFQGGGLVEALGIGD